MYRQTASDVDKRAIVNFSNKGFLRGWRMVKHNLYSINIVDLKATQWRWDSLQTDRQAVQQLKSVWKCCNTQSVSLFAVQHSAVWYKTHYYVESFKQVWCSDLAVNFGLLGSKGNQYIYIPNTEVQFIRWISSWNILIVKILINSNCCIDGRSW